ncbi:MAG: M48 family metallopeptidase [Bacilli bacterium]|nr:M48 family metallopeptidase [Bacilli bacterium]
MKKEGRFAYKNEEFPVLIEYKRIRNIHYRIKDGIIKISSPYAVSERYLYKELEKYFPELYERYTKYKDSFDIGFKAEGVYIYGELVPFSDGFIKVDNHYILFNDKDDFYKKIKKYVRPYFESLLRKHEQIMGIKNPYKLTLRYTKTRYGSNSKNTHNITLSLFLVHFSEEIIESVIIHELTHDKYRNHQKEFYDRLYLFCPNYDILTKKLKKGILK